MQIKILEICIRLLFLFSAFITYIGTAWFADQRSIFENITMFLLAIIMVFLAAVSYKLVNSIFYAVIASFGLLLFIYFNFIENSISSVGLQGILFVIAQIFGFIFLIFLAIKYKKLS